MLGGRNRRFLEKYYFGRETNDSRLVLFFSCSAVSSAASKGLPPRESRLPKSRRHKTVHKVNARCISDSGGKNPRASERARQHGNAHFHLPKTPRGVPRRGRQSPRGRLGGKQAERVAALRVHRGCCNVVSGVRGGWHAFHRSAATRSSSRWDPRRSEAESSGRGGRDDTLLFRSAS